MKRVVISAGKKAMLRQWAVEFENKDFLAGDPSWFMHQVEGRENQEVMSFLAACLSYGSRPLFLPKIQRLLDWADGKPFEWVRTRGYEQSLPDTDDCYYRLYTCHDMRQMLAALNAMLERYGSICGFMRILPAPTAMSALEQTTAWFRLHGSGGIIPSTRARPANACACGSGGWCATAARWTSASGATSSTSAHSSCRSTRTSWSSPSPWGCCPPIQRAWRPRCA